MRKCRARRWSKTTGSTCGATPVGRPETVDGIVQPYIENFRHSAAEEMQFYARQPSLDKAIEKAALSETNEGKRHDHQRRLSADTLSNRMDPNPCPKKR